MINTGAVINPRGSEGGVGGWGLNLGQKHFLSLVTLAAAPHPPVVGAPPVLGH